MKKVSQTNNMANMVWCTFRLVGFHQYPDAPAEVGFLAARHRHVFHFKVRVEVAHDNREVEFLTLQRWCLEQYEKGELEMENRSCEMLAKELIAKLAQHKIYATMDDGPGYHKQRQIIVDVSEDGECGATYSRL